MPASRSGDDPFVESPATAPTAGRAIARPGWGVPAWAGVGSNVSVGTFILEAPHLYVGRNLPARWAACIDLALPTDAAGLSARPGAGTYAQLTARQRQRFLAWVQRGRTGTLEDEAFLRVFLANAEEFLLSPGRAAQELGLDSPDRSALLNELQQLSLRYASVSGVLAQQCGDLHDFVRLRVLDAAGKRAYEDGSFSQVPTARPSTLLRFALGHLCEDGKPLAARWAYQWARSMLKRQEAADLAHCGEQLRRLFVQKYVQAHGEGLPLSAGQRDHLDAVYLACNPALTGQRWELSQTAVVVQYATQWTTPLLILLNQCLEELSPFIRARAQGKEFDDCWQLLPVTLWPEAQRLAFRSLVQSALEGPTPASFSALAPYFRLLMPFGKKALALLQTRLAEVQLQAVPDLQGEHRPTSGDSPFILLAQDHACEQTRCAKAFVPLLRMCVGHLEPTQDKPLGRVLSRFIETASLPRAERACHRAYLLFAQNGGFKKLTPSAFAKLDLDQQEQILELAREVFATETVLALPSFAKYFGDDWLQQPVAALKLDAGRVASLVLETNQVHELLGGVFTEATGGTTPEPHRAPAEVAPVAPSKSAKHWFVHALSDREEWPHEELEALAAQRGLMLAGTLEWLNDLAYEKCGAPALEEQGETWLADPTVVLELKAVLPL